MRRSGFRIRVTGRAGRPAQRYALRGAAGPGVGPSTLVLARSPQLAPRPGVPPAPRGRALPAPSRLTASNGVPRGRRRRRRSRPRRSALPPQRTTVLVLAREATYAARLALRLVPRLVLRRLFPLALLALFAFPLLLVLATALLLRVVFLAT